MPVADRQMLSELVDCADVAVRAASQLELFRLGRAIRDSEALERAVEFLHEAEGGGEFIASGNSANLRATLRPLNWAAAVRSRRTAGSQEKPVSEVDYDDVTQYLRQVRSTVKQVREGKQPDAEDLKESVGFFDDLGETLGTRATQRLRRPSTPRSRIGSF